MRILIAAIFMVILGGQTAMAENFQFDSIDGGTMSIVGLARPAGFGGQHRFAMWVYLSI